MSNYKQFEINPDYNKLSLNRFGVLFLNFVNKLNDFVSFALSAHRHRHLKLCLGLNFQVISFPFARVLAS